MTYKEAYENIKATLNDEGYRITDSVLETAMKALEKQIPKKPAKDEYGSYFCPNCMASDYSLMHDNNVADAYNCCANCGQAIDWDASNEN